MVAAKGLKLAESRPSSTPSMSADPFVRGLSGHQCSLTWSPCTDPLHKMINNKNDLVSFKVNELLLTTLSRPIQHLVITDNLGSSNATPSY